MGAFGRIVAALLVTFCASTAFAQDYPSKTIRFVVPNATGGASDLIARIIGQKLSEQWGQSIIIDNRDGAGGNIGTAFVAKSKPDGYTWLLGFAGTNAINPSVYKHLQWEPKEFIPVSLVANLPFVLVINKDLPMRNLSDLIAYAKQNPGALKYGSGGFGTVNHMLGAMLASVADIKLTHVPYRGIAAATTDLLGGRIQMVMSAIPSVLDQVNAGALRAVVVTSAKRADLLKNVPTVAESGFPGFDVTPWFGMLAPAGTPADVVTKINGAVNKLLEQKDLVDQFNRLGMEASAPMTPAQFGKIINDDIAKWAVVVKETGATIDD